VRFGWVVLLRESQALAGTPTQDRGFVSGNRFASTWFASLPVPLPRNYVQGIDTQRADLETGRASYLCGHWSLKGWWYYYIFGLLLKLPAGTLVLCALALLVGMLRLPNLNCWRDESVLLLPAVGILMLVSSQTGFSAHCRYVIPALPFLYVWAGRVACAAVGKAKAWSRVAIAALLSWTVFSSLAVYPHSLSYFNELVGGPLNGPSFLLGSNVDWGQDLLFLKQWLKQNPDARPFRLAYHGCVDPPALGLDFQGPTAGGFNQDLNGVPPGWYAVSVNCLFGDSMGHPRGAYTYFRRLRPAARAGYSIYIFWVRHDDRQNPAVRRFR